MAYDDLNEWLATLEKEGELAKIDKQVDWDLEIGGIVQENFDRKGPALLFENIKDQKVQSPEDSDSIMNLEGTESSHIETGGEIDSTVEHFIRTIVNTHEFAKMFFERLRKAAKGEIKPLTNLILGLVKKFNPEEVDLWELAQKILAIAREELKAPEDNELWNQILDSVKVELVT